MNDIVQFVMRLTLLWTNLDLLTRVPTTSDNVCYYVFVMITIIVISLQLLIIYFTMAIILSSRLSLSLLHNTFLLILIGSPNTLRGDCRFRWRKSTRQKDSKCLVTRNCTTWVPACMKEASRRRITWLVLFESTYAIYHLPRYLRTWDFVITEWVAI